MTPATLREQAIQMLRRNILARIDPRLSCAVRNARFLFFASRGNRAAWRRRTELVVACPDNAFISRVPDAGSVRRGYQLMHNGVRVLAGGYYGYPLREMLCRNGGVHEPQEERAFQEVLPHLRQDGVMVELGSYWGFYSLWFKQAVPRGRCLLVEPDLLALAVGRHNFEINGVAGEFYQAYVGQRSSSLRGVPVISVDDLAGEYKFTHVDVLHADIQGAELDMLRGADRLLRDGNVSYLFISTHSPELHVACAKHLSDLGFLIVASIGPADSFSEDGVLIAKRRDVPGPDSIALSRRSDTPWSSW
jgi:hypothetical protein